MPTQQRFRSNVTTLAEMKNHYVYILTTHNFYGKDPDLRQFSYDEVKKAVMDTLNISAGFVENAITENTTLLIVPDDWDRKLPKEVQHLAKHLIYLPFSYILHPDVTSPSKMLELMAPPDSAYYIMLKEQKRPLSQHSFELSKVAPDDIMERFQGWRFGVVNEKSNQVGFTAATHEMHPWDAFTPTMGSKKKLSRKKDSTMKGHSDCMKGHATKMSVKKRESSADAKEKEYKEAWDRLIAHAHKMQAHEEKSKPKHSKKKMSLSRRG